jgi:hypothetical protein
VPSASLQRPFKGNTARKVPRWLVMARCAREHPSTTDDFSHGDQSMGAIRCDVVWIDRGGRRSIQTTSCPTTEGRQRASGWFKELGVVWSPHAFARVTAIGSDAGW